MNQGRWHKISAVPQIKLLRPSEEGRVKSKAVSFISPELFEGFIHSLLQFSLGFVYHLHLLVQLLLHRVPHHVDGATALTERQAVDGNIQRQVLCLEGTFCCFLHLEEEGSWVCRVSPSGTGGRKEGEPTDTLAKRASHCLALQF